MQFVGVTIDDSTSPETYRDGDIGEFLDNYFLRYHNSENVDLLDETLDFEISRKTLVKH